MTAALFAAAVSFTGISAAALFGARTERFSASFSAFAVGLLTTAVLFHLLPEAIAETSDALAWVGTGFMLMTLIGITVQIFAHSSQQGAALTFGYASIIALSAHSMLDGVIYAVIFQEDMFTGWYTISGLLLHEFPEGVIAFFLLYTAGLRGLSVFFGAFLAAGLTTAFGALLANLALMATPVLPPLGALHGAAAGAIIYVLVVHLGPHAARAQGGRGYLMAQLGVIISTAAVILRLMGGDGGHTH